jgi:hypothetical protein
MCRASEGSVWAGRVEGTEGQNGRQTDQSTLVEFLTPSFEET